VITILLLAVVVVPGLLGWLLSRIHPLRNDERPSRWHAGDPIVYRVQKASTHPGLRAREVHPAALGDTYIYLVDKFWAVKDVLDDGRIVAVTRTLKQRQISPDDPNLRKPGPIERLRYRTRFPRLAGVHS
jgi:hypothetical protein